MLVASYPLVDVVNGLVDGCVDIVDAVGGLVDFVQNSQQQFSSS